MYARTRPATLVALLIAACSAVPTALAAPTMTTTTLAISSGGSTVTTVTAGTAVTLSATVTAGNAAVKTGLVNFCDATAAQCTDAHLLGAAQLTNAGTAVLKFIPGIGSHSYKAAFLGTPNGAASTAASTSGNVALTVTGRFSTSTVIAPSGSIGNYSLTATVVGSGSPIAPTGTVSFLDTTNANTNVGSAPLGTGTLTQTFASSTISVPGEQSSIVTADFNGDGIPDFAVSGYSSADNANAVIVMLGNGDGTFIQKSTTVSAELSAQLGLAVGDFNSDGIPDVAVYDGSYGPLLVLLGQGDGTFTIKFTYNDPVSNDFSGVAVGDFNGDGIPDLALTNSSGGNPDSNTVTVLLGNGDGTFTPKSNPGVGSAPTSIVARDLNGDGILDLAVANAFGNSVSVLLGNGDGTFTTKSTPATGNHPDSVVVADFNSDGIPDLATANFDDNTVSVLLGNGNGTFSAPLTSPAGSSPEYSQSPEYLAVGDFNADGILDLAVITMSPAPSTPAPTDFDNTISVLLGKGDGTFTAQPFLIAGDIPSSIAVADVKGNGLADIVVGNLDGTVSEFLNQITQTATATATGISPLGTGIHQVEASYPGDSLYNASISSIVGLTAQQVTPTVTETLSSASITTAQALSVMITASGKSGKPTPTGTVTLNSGTYTSAATTLSSGGATIDIPAGSLATGTDTLTITYSGDSNYNSTSGTASLTVSPPPAASPIFTPGTGSYVGAQSVTIADATSGATIYYTINGTTPTTSSTKYTGAIAVSSTETIAALAVASGYANSVVTSATYTITPVKTPTMTVTPSSSSITTAQALTVAVSVKGGSGNPTPTGSVTLTSSSYTSAATTLSSGSTTISIPAGSLTAGLDALTVNYTPDTASSSAYNSASGSASVTVTIPPTITIGGTSATLTPGATTGNTSNITITPSGGFTGNVALTAAITSSPVGAQDLPTLSFGSTSPVAISGANAVTATLTISTTAATTAVMLHPTGPAYRWYAGGAALACILFFGIPARRRSWRTMLAMLFFLAFLTGGLLSCGGGGSGGGGAGGGSGGGGGTSNPGTTAGTYTITVTGTAGATTATEAVTLTVQ
ncbi:MAG TPA: FG-GAP-like repeat-containing protein [Silvibacterium sp.]|nr:FG-GAP-like repeat-containing protein [Silvibacterium sp.]